MAAADSITFLGTGSFVAPSRYWNSFVVNRRILVEPAPSALANMRPARIGSDELDAVFISHFHPDHCFGWPFLALELARKGRRQEAEAADGRRPLYIVGPPGVRNFLDEMMRLGSVQSISELLHERIDVRYVEVDGTAQKAGALSFRAHRVVHAPRLECFGYVFELEGVRLGYSGDTEPCEGLEAIASASDVLVLECAEVKPTATHMNAAAVKELSERHHALRIIVSHLGEGVDEADLGRVEVPHDLQTIEL